jgi:hypothetical protein
MTIESLKNIKKKYCNYDPEDWSEMVASGELCYDQLKSEYKIAEKCCQDKEKLKQCLQCIQFIDEYENDYDYQDIVDLANYLRNYFEDMEMPNIKRKLEYASPSSPNKRSTAQQLKRCQELRKKNIQENKKLKEKIKVLKERIKFLENK